MKSAVLPALEAPIMHSGTGFFCFFCCAFVTKTFAFPGAPVVFAADEDDVSPN